MSSLLECYEHFDEKCCFHLPSRSMFYHNARRNNKNVVIFINIFLSVDNILDGSQSEYNRNESAEESKIRNIRLVLNTIREHRRSNTGPLFCSQGMVLR
jgi:hypothetical protein